MEDAKENSPNDLLLPCQVFSLDFSPVQDCIASGLIDGQLHLYNYSSDENKLVLHMKIHKGACRAVQFTEDGQRVYTVSADQSIKEIDLNTVKISWGQGKAHNTGINTMLTYEKYIFTGDDDGVVKVWDDRSKKDIFTFMENEDFIGDFAFHENRLLCPSGDGTLSIFDLRKGKLDAMSDNMDDELLSVVVVKNGSKVICGSQGGILNIFSWGFWGDISDRFPGHPDSIDSIVAINDDTICTGSSDGLIRVVNIHPNKLLGVIGEHEDYPVERLAISRDANLLASCSHDSSVKFWNISFFWEEDSEQEGTDDKRPNKKLEEELEPTKMKKEEKRVKDFFSDL